MAPSLMRGDYHSFSCIVLYERPRTKAHSPIRSEREREGGGRKNPCASMSNPLLVMCPCACTAPTSFFSRLLLLVAQLQPLSTGFFHLFATRPTSAASPAAPPPPPSLPLLLSHWTTGAHSLIMFQLLLPSAAPPWQRPLVYCHPTSVPLGAWRSTSFLFLEAERSPLTSRLYRFYFLHLFLHVGLNNDVRALFPPTHITNKGGERDG